MRAFIDIFSQTLRTLWAHKLRSFLTMFGIAWGVGSLLLLVGLGEGFRSGNQRELDSIGKDTVDAELGTLRVPERRRRHLHDSFDDGFECTVYRRGHGGRQYQPV